MIRLPNLMLGLSAALLLSVLAANPAAACDHCHSTACCEPAPVCCPPPPVEVDLCVVDPVTCCKYPVTVCVPACCAAEKPCLADCRRGLFGRKILTYKWPCCGHCVEVVITHFGRTIVRD